MPELVVSSELGATLRSTFKDNGYALFEGVFSAQQARQCSRWMQPCSVHCCNTVARRSIDRSLLETNRPNLSNRISIKCSAANPPRAVQGALRHTKSPILPAPMPVGICFRQVERWWRLAEAWMDRQWPAKNDPRRYNFEEALGANRTVRMDATCRWGFTSVCHSCVDESRSCEYTDVQPTYPCGESLVCCEWAHVR